MTIKFVIPGIPKPKQSVRSGVVYRAGKPVTFIDKNTGKERVLQTKFQTAEVKENERAIKLIIKEQLPPEFQIVKGEVKIKKLHYVFPPLSSFSKKKMNEIQQGKIIHKTTKPDLDSNLNKGLFDAMEGIVYINDSQICEINNLTKYYGFEPRTEIEISVDENECSKPKNLFSEAIC